MIMGAAMGATMGKGMGYEVHSTYKLFNSDRKLDSEPDYLKDD